jgi:hypothetical protein
VSILIDNAGGGGGSIFNVETDFEYLGMISDVPIALIARPTLPASNFRELMAWIGQNKGKINVGKPPDVQKKLNDALKIRRLGIARWSPIIKAAGVYAD